MRAFKVFIFGLLYGWFLKFVIDRVYRADEIKDLRNENIALNQYIHSLEKQVRQKTPASQNLTAPAPGTVQASAATRTSTRKDDLKLLKGVGPTIEKRLNDAGIYSFADLAQLTPQELEQRLVLTRRISAKVLIAEAKRLAQKR